MKYKEKKSKPGPSDKRGVASLAEAAEWCRRQGIEEIECMIPVYIGLIALSLPGARIVHVRRDPMDNGYALLKTLFRTGCPYSYSQSDLGRYIGAYHRLMAHWRSVLPGRMVEVDYEDLIEDQEGESRRLIAALGLDWEPSLLDFHANPAPAATASAAQVRRPIYRDSLGLWRRYATQLQPLAESLMAQGVL